MTVFVFAFFLTACSQDISGTWYAEEGFSGAFSSGQLRLEIDKEEVSIWLDTTTTEFWSGEEKEDSELIARGRVKGKTIVLTEEGQSEEETSSYRLSGDKKSLILEQNGHELVFHAQPPKN